MLYTYTCILTVYIHTHIHSSLLHSNEFQCQSQSCSSLEFCLIHPSLCLCHFCPAAQFTDIKVNGISIRNHSEGPQFICNNYSMKDAFLGHGLRHFSALITAYRFCGFIENCEYLRPHHWLKKYMWNIHSCMIHLLSEIDGGEHVTHSREVEKRHQGAVPGKYASTSSLWQLI